MFVCLVFTVQSWVESFYCWPSVGSHLHQGVSITALLDCQCMDSCREAFSTFLPLDRQQLSLYVCVFYLWVDITSLPSLYCLYLNYFIVSWVPLRRIKWGIQEDDPVVVMRIVIIWKTQRSTTGRQKPRVVVKLGDTEDETEEVEVEGDATAAEDDCASEGGADS